MEAENGCSTLRSHAVAASDKACSLLGEDKITQAEQVFAALEDEILKHEHLGGCTDCAGFIDELLKSDKRVRARQLAARVHNLRSNLGSDQDWTLQREADGIRTMYRQLPESPYVCIRAECEIDSPVVNILALFYEVDLFKEWMPTYRYLGLKDAAVLHNPSPTRMLIHVSARAPWPVQDRDMCMAVHGIDCMDADNELRQIVVLLESVVAYDGLDVPAPDPAMVRMDLQHGGLVLTPSAVNGGGSATRLQLMCMVDPKLPVIPAWLINFLVRNLAFMVLEKVRAEIASLAANAVYRNRIATKTHFYGFIRKRLEEVHLPAHHARSIFDTT